MIPREASRLRMYPPWGLGGGSLSWHAPPRCPFSLTAKTIAWRCTVTRLAVDPIEDDERGAGVAKRGAFDQPTGDPFGPGFALRRFEVELGLGFRQAAQRRSDGLTPLRTPARVA